MTHEDDGLALSAARRGHPGQSRGRWKRTGMHPSAVLSLLCHVASPGPGLWSTATGAIPYMGRFSCRKWTAGTCTPRDGRQRQRQATLARFRQEKDKPAPEGRADGRRATLLPASTCHARAGHLARMRAERLAMRSTSQEMRPQASFEGLLEAFTGRSCRAGIGRDEADKAACLSQRPGGAPVGEWLVTGHARLREGLRVLVGSAALSVGV